MIVCSCNALSDHDVRAHFASASHPPHKVAEAYRCCGKTPVCGRCAPTLRCILRELDAALGEQPDTIDQQERQPAAA